ncbi:hypothetical protein BP6252_03527 [Coleophoma cylindrospora]|uniref:Uncharacterized protein n=1 Tax=Coleophoma cylindrospora TaxID=1849047 RepID=A0A3D8S7W2_9HELO|nr:hypothetical protein BP6252_03527 [Coleophoma cylindrospora]
MSFSTTNKRLLPDDEEDKNGIRDVVTDKGQMIIHLNKRQRVSEGDVDLSIASNGQYDDNSILLQAVCYFGELPSEITQEIFKLAIGGPTAKSWAAGQVIEAFTPNQRLYFDAVYAYVATNYFDLARFKHEWRYHLCLDKYTRSQVRKLRVFLDHSPPYSFNQMPIFVENWHIQDFQSLQVVNFQVTATGWLEDSNTVKFLDYWAQCFTNLKRVEVTIPITGYGPTAFAPWHSHDQQKEIGIMRLNNITGVYGKLAWVPDETQSSGHDEIWFWQAPRGQLLRIPQYGMEDKMMVEEI